MKRDYQRGQLLTGADYPVLTGIDDGTRSSAACRCSARRSRRELDRPPTIWHGSRRGWTAPSSCWRRSARSAAATDDLARERRRDDSARRHCFHFRSRPGRLCHRAGSDPLTPLPPLLHEHHGAPVGKVIHLAYHDGRLLARAETDYPAAIGASHFSVNLRGATRKREGNERPSSPPRDWSRFQQRGIRATPRVGSSSGSSTIRRRR